MEQNKILDIIINLLQGIKSNNEIIETTNEKKVMSLRGCSYLLNQTLRQYNLPQEHYFISEKAFVLWKKISTDNIFNYTYRDKVVKNVDCEVLIDKYKGSEKTPYQKELSIKKGSTFIYNDVFTDEHIVTVSNIIEEMLQLPTYDYVSIKSILEKIYICKMLKSEDHMIKNKRKRSTDYREVLIEDYLDAGIKIKDFNYKAELERKIFSLKKELEELESKN